MNPASLANAMAQRLGFAPKDGVHCVKCRKRFRFNPGPAAQKPGDIYSQAGHTEAKKHSGLCEFCYDNLFGSE